MRACVVYESMFGNTEIIARGIAEGLEASAEVVVAEVGTAPDVGEADLLVVGGPTHAFGMTRPGTRQDASQRARGQIVSRGGGVREWLATLQPPRRRVAAAAFDTRIDKPRVPGSAARGVERRLHKLGFAALSQAESFYVTDVAGPLLPGEVERARQWGRDLAERLAAAASPVR